MRTGFVWLPDAKAVACYDLKTGKKLLGEQSVHGSTHYFDPKTGAMRTGITALPKTKAHAKEQACFDEFDGSMITGEATVSGKTYYFDQGTGGMVHNGWRSAGGGLYAYYGGDGTIVRGEKWIDGERYWFDADSGRASLAQFLRWNLSHAPGAAGVACFNGLNLTAGQLSGVNDALAGFSHEGYSAGFVIMDLKTGKGLSGNADGVFYSASTVKAPYIASVYQGAFHNSVDASAPWYSTLDDICVWSDNYQYAYLRSTFGNQVFADWLVSVGVDAGKAAHNYAWYSARDLGKMWLGMYDYFQNGGPAGGQLASLLSHGFGSSIYMELGGECSVSSKGGWYPTLPGYTATGDGGIVRSKTGDYLVVVLSNAPERFDLTRALVRELDNAHRLF